MDNEKQQDGIEERDNRSLMRSRPREVCRVCGSIDVHTDTYGQPTMKCIGYISHIGNEARAETATLTDENNRLREALRELLESAKHAQMETHETFTSNTLFDAVVKAEKIFDTDADR